MHSKTWSDSWNKFVFLLKQTLLGLSPPPPPPPHDPVVNEGLQIAAFVWTRASAWLLTLLFKIKVLRV